MKIINQVNAQIIKGLTYEELKKCKGFENITEEEAEKELETINKIAKIMYYMYINEFKKEE